MRFVLIIVLVIFLVGCSQAPESIANTQNSADQSGDASMSDTTYTKIEDQYYIKITSTSLELRGGINGVPFIKDLDAEGVVTTEPVNDWIKPGENTLTVDLRWPDSVPYQEGVASLEAQVFIHDMSQQTPTPKEIVATVTFPSDEMPEGYPKSIKIPFDVPLETTSHLWNEAQKFETLSQEDKDAMFAVLSQFHKELSDGNFDAAGTMLDYKWKDEAITSLSGTSSQQIVIDQYSNVIGSIFTMTPLSQDLTYFLVGDGQVVSVVEIKPTGEEYSAIRAGEDDGGRIEIPVYMSKVNGEWKLVR